MNTINKKKLAYIIGTTIITIVLLYISDQVLQLSYMYKILCKIILFLLFPIIYSAWTGDHFIKDSLSPKKKFKIKLSHLLGVVIFILIIVAFNLFKGFINLDVLLLEFEQKYKINQSNVLVYGIYFVFANSLFEEFFFRGFIFLNLKKLGLRKTAYLVSSIAFSIYHISNFQNWFNNWIFVLALIGLIIGGMIFNCLDDKENTFLNSWFVHICADLALVGIGLHLFKLF